MLTRGNSKLGKIYNWSIPAIKTCPGRSKLCEALCYAAEGFFLMPSVKNVYAKNWRTARTKSFADRMIAEIHKKKCDIVRIHVAGDFFDATYIRKWAKIIKACPETRFYAYTRSWRVKRLTKALKELAALENLQLWWSVDKETGRGPNHPRIKQAYLATDDTDVPAFPVDLVFREKVETVMKKVDGVQVCPYETGLKIEKITCQTCKICFKNANSLISIGSTA